MTFFQLQQVHRNWCSVLSLIEFSMHTNLHLNCLNDEKHLVNYKTIIVFLLCLFSYCFYTDIVISWQSDTLYLEHLTNLRIISASITDHCPTELEKESITKAAHKLCGLGKNLQPTIGILLSYQLSHLVRFDLAIPCDECLPGLVLPSLSAVLYMSISSSSVLVSEKRSSPYDTWQTNACLSLKLTNSFWLEFIEGEK